MASFHEKSSTFLWKPTLSFTSDPLCPCSSVLPSLTLVMHHLRALLISFVMFCLYFCLSLCLWLIEFWLFSFTQNLSIYPLSLTCLCLQKTWLRLQFLFQLWHLERSASFLRFRCKVWLIYFLLFDHFLQFQKEELEVDFLFYCS